MNLDSYRVRAVHLVALWAYAVSQPVFSLLEGNPEFLVVRGSTRAEVAIFALLLMSADHLPQLVSSGSSRKSCKPPGARFISCF